MPVYVLASTFFMMPVRLIGFVRMAHSASWGHP
jgi:hyaluronan synthase